MRAVLPLLAGVLAVLAAPCAQAQTALPMLEARVPLNIIHPPGQPLRFGRVGVEAGDVDQGPVGFRFRYDAAAQDMGAPAWATWMIVLDDGYCRDEPTGVRAVLTAPSGQSWRGPFHGVPAGPDHSPLKIYGFGDAEDHPGLFEAFAAGGRFNLALENDRGERWNAVQIDTLDPATRERLFDANRATLRATRADSVSARREDRIEYLAPALGAPPAVRPCPAA